MSERQQPQYPDERPSGLRRNIYITYIACTEISQEISNKLAGEGGNLRMDALDLRRMFGRLFLTTQYDKQMDNIDKDGLKQISWWLLQRIPSPSEDKAALRRYCRFGVKCFEWYSMELLQRGVILVEPE